MNLLLLSMASWLWLSFMSHNYAPKMILLSNTHICGIIALNFGVLVIYLITIYKRMANVYTKIMNLKSVNSLPDDVAKHSVFRAMPDLFSRCLCIGYPGCWLCSQLRSGLLLRVNQLLKTQRPGKQKIGKNEPVLSPTDQLCAAEGDRVVAPATDPRMDHRYPREVTGGSDLRLV